MALNRGSTGLNVYRGDTQQKVYRGSTLILDTADSVSWSGQLRKRTAGGTSELSPINADGTQNLTLISGFELPAEWMSNGSVAYVRWITLFGTSNTPNFTGRVFFRIHTADSGDGAVSGPDLIDSLETSLQFDVVSGNSSVSFVLNSGTADDTSEPYSFLPSNSADIRDFVNGFASGLHTFEITLTNPN